MLYERSAVDDVLRSLIAEDGTTSLLSPPAIDGEQTLAAQAMAIAAAFGLDEPPPLADFVVDLLEADALLDKTPWHFSRGERQMAGLILTFARPFQSVVLIEPTSGLDQRRTDAVMHFVEDLAADEAVYLIKR